MKKHILYTIFVAVISGMTFTSCDDAFGDFLEKQPSNELTEEQVFASWKNTQAFYYDMYGFLRNGLGRINKSWMDSATDLAQTSYSWGGTRSSFNIGNYYASGGAPEIKDTWGHYYRAIRKCNQLLARVDDVPLGPEENQNERDVEASQMKASVRVLRAYFYWELALRYGAVPIIEYSLDPDESNLDIARPESAKTTFQFVLKELSESYEYLQDDSMIADNDLGRITKGMSLALMSRIKLYLASPRYQDLNLATWADAAYAAEIFMRNYGDGIRYALVDMGGNADAYQQAINRPVINKVHNMEVIFWRNDEKSNWLPNETPVGYGGNGGLCPSQNVVDMYDMANGLSPFAQYDHTGSPVYNANGVPAINVASGYDDNNPYANRDPRFYKTVLYNGTTWYNRAIETFVGGADNPTGNANATPTGYYNRKYMDDSNTDPLLPAKNMDRNWIFIRYAEILLNYAEAQNEVNGPTQEVFNTLQMLRNRVGMTAKLSDRTDLNNQSNMRNFIRKERTIELAFEDHRSWDVRRWNVAEEALSRPVYGITITKTGTELTFKRKVAQSRVFSNKMYLYPVPEEEVWKTGMKNNPGW